MHALAQPVEFTLSLGVEELVGLAVLSIVFFEDLLEFIGANVVFHHELCQFLLAYRCAHDLPFCLHTFRDIKGIFSTEFAALGTAD